MYTYIYIYTYTYKVFFYSIVFQCEHSSRPFKFISLIAYNYTNFK